METVQVGKTGLEVGRIGLGCMSLSLSGRPEESSGIKVLHAALDAGMSLLDTADVYCIDDDDTGHNERLIRRALREWPGGADGVVVATKGGLIRPRGDWVPKGDPAHLRQACERSLQALGVERIDLYQLHAPDPFVPLADSVGALAELQREGKIRHVGLSNVSVREIELARGIVDIVSVQNRFNPRDLRSLKNGVVELCEAEQIAFLPYSPVGGPGGHRRLSADPRLAAVARAMGATAYQVCLAWIMTLSPAMIPIPGTSRIESALASAAVADLALDAEAKAALDGAFL